MTHGQAYEQNHNGGGMSDRTRLENALLRIEAEARIIAMADFDDTHASLCDAINALDALRAEINERRKREAA